MDYILLFPVLVLEGPVATIVAGFLSSPGGNHLLNVGMVTLVVFVADIAGDTMYYFIGRYAKKWLTSRHPKKFSVDPTRLRGIEEYYKKHGVKTMMIGKVSHGLGWPVMVGAGSSRMSYRKFITVSALVSVPKSILLVALGYYYGAYYETLVGYMGKVGLIMTTLAVIIVAYWVLRSRKEEITLQ